MHNLFKQSSLALLALATTSSWATSEGATNQDSKHVTLSEAHHGALFTDLKILNQFEEQPVATQQFYIEARDAILRKNYRKALDKIFKRYDRIHMGGPMLGDLSTESVTIWMQFPNNQKISISVTNEDKSFSQTYSSLKASTHHHQLCDGLSANTKYSYTVSIPDSEIILGSGTFTTAPSQNYQGVFKLAVGADFHKIGLHRPELLDLVQSRGNIGMLLLGDLAVDGRRSIPERNIDYLLRDISPVWQRFAAHIPSYTSWDDHDYYGNDTGGLYLGNPNNKIDVNALRKNWKRMWNNPERQVNHEGIYFQTHIGPAHIIMLDTRSCRINEKRGQLHSFLGERQTKWALKAIQQSTAPYLIITSGTMWTNYISHGKDSWGTWDTEGLEEILSALDQKADSKILLFSGDRHGAHAFGIKRPNGRTYTEFGVGTLGGVQGGGEAKDKSTQLFAYPGAGTWAYGELQFDTTVPDSPEVTFSLINTEGQEIETVEL